MSASEPKTSVNWAVPAGACDTHTHVFLDPRKFPFWPGRAYTPEVATVDELLTLHRALRMDRVVIVHPSVYGTDNSASLEGVKQLGARARCVAVIDDKTPEADLDAMGRSGVCGIRLNLETAGQTDPAVGRRRFQEATRRIERRGWHIQLYTRLSVIASIADLVLASPVPVVFDHFGGARGELGIGQPGLSDLVGLVRSGKAYVKISGAYRSSTQAPEYRDMAPLARMLIEANPERIVWGTDWPHPDMPKPGKSATDIAPFHQIDDGALLNQLPVWAPDAAVRKRILVDNPARLYGFD